MSHLHVRVASPQDLQAIWAIEKDSFSDPYPPSLLERLLRDFPRSFFAASDESGELVGYSVSTLKGKSAHLISIAVTHSYRRTGVGSALMETVIGYLKEQGARYIWLEVKLDNVAAIAFYRKFGFEKVLVLPRYYSDGSPALKMRLALESSTSGIKEK